MKRKIFLYCFCFFLLLENAAFASFDKGKVENLVNLFTELMTNYSNAANTSIAESKRIELYKLFGRPQLGYSFDLFNDVSEAEQTPSNYLRVIEVVYENKLLFDFEDLHIFSCTANIAGKQFAFVTLRKTIEYLGNKTEFKNKKKKVKILIGIDINELDYKIDRVIFPEEYVSPDKGCTIDEKQDEQNVLFGENCTLAELAFSRKDYVSAKEFYERSLLYRPNDTKIFVQLNKCYSVINYESYQTNAKKYFSEGYYSKAKELYDKIASQYPDKREYALNKIKICDEQIRVKNYLEFKKMGDESFNKQFYNTALENFQSALKYEPNDSYSISMIKKCANADVSTAMNEIKKARELIYHRSKKYFPEIIQIYTYYEPSGLLSGLDYYNMAAILDVGYGNVTNKLNYTKIQSFHLAKEYCLKSMAKGYSSADDLWYDRFNRRSRKL